MSLKKPIQIIFCWLVATVLLVVTMGSFTYDAPSDGDTTEQVTSDNPTDNETLVSELRLDAVVIGLFSYHFSPYALPTPQVSVVFPEKSASVLSSCFTEPLFFFKYFLKVFGKHIASNAP